MSNSQRLYHTVTRVIVSQCSTLRLTQTRNLAWFIVGVVLAAQCQLTQIAPHLPWAGNRESIVQRLRRVLMNQRLAVRTLYGPTVGYILHWLNNGQPLILVIDRTTIGDELNILLISRSKTRVLRRLIERHDNSGYFVDSIHQISRHGSKITTKLLRSLFGFLGRGSNTLGKSIMRRTRIASPI